MMSCEEFEELAGAFALGALTEDEMRAAHEHLDSCDEAHTDAREMMAVAAGLASAAPEMEPPPALKSRLMDAIRAESAESTATASPASGQGILEMVRGWFRTGALGYGLSGALAVLVVALVVWNVSLQDDDGGNQLVVGLNGAAGQLTVLPDQDVVIMDVADLAPAPAGHVYQVWAVTSGQAASLGIVEVPADGTVHQAMVFDETGVDQIAITIEPEPGVDQPTTDPVITADL